MLKRIATQQVRLGMHIHSLSGSWLSHPFWRTRFVLDDPADLERLRKSGVKSCWIDLSKGVGPVEQGSAEAVQEVTDTEPPPDVANEAPVATVSFTEEAQRAASVISQSRGAVQAMFAQARLGKVIDTAACKAVVDEIAGSVWRNPNALVSLARLRKHDDYSYMHSVAVCALMVALGRRMGLDPDQTREAGMAGLLHDMGKSVMPLEVLNKPGRLTDAEFGIMKGHPERGHEILQEMGVTSVGALDVCLHHHERVDGGGYPHGLVDEEISALAKMGAVCDVYDAVSSNRPYKVGWDPAEAISRMAGWRQGHFDERIFQAFIKTVGIYPTGSLVRMQSGRLAVVVAQHATSLISPTVRVFFSTRSQMPIPVETLDLSATSCTDRILARESNSQWKFPHLAELWAGGDVLYKMPHL